MKEVRVDINKLNYTTASGNRCRIKVLAVANGRAGLDITWTRQASPEDIKEYEEWIPGALSDQGVTLVIEKSVYEQSEARRRAICEDFINTPNPED